VGVFKFYHPALHCDKEIIAANTLITLVMNVGATLAAKRLAGFVTTFRAFMFLLHMFAFHLGGRHGCCSEVATGFSNCSKIAATLAALCFAGLVGTLRTLPFVGACGRGEHIATGVASGGRMTKSFRCCIVRVVCDHELDDAVAWIEVRPFATTLAAKEHHFVFLFAFGMARGLGILTSTTHDSFSNKVENQLLHMLCVMMPLHEGAIHIFLDLRCCAQLVAQVSQEVFRRTADTFTYLLDVYKNRLLHLARALELDEDGWHLVAKVTIVGPIQVDVFAARKRSHFADVY